MQVQVDQRHRVQQSFWQVDSESLALAVAKAARAGAAELDEGWTVDAVCCSQVQMSSVDVARQSAWGSNVD